MATATRSLSEELLTLKEEMGWSWSEMANQVEGALNVKGPSGSTLFRYAKGQANPSDLVEQTVLRAIQTIRENQLAEIEEDQLEAESSTVSERSITEIEKAEVAEAESEYVEPEAAVVTEEAEVSAVDEEVTEEVAEVESAPEIPESPWNAEGLIDVPFAVGICIALEVEVPESPWNAEGLIDVPFGVGIVAELEVELPESPWNAEGLNDVPFAGGIAMALEVEEVEETAQFGIERIDWVSLDTDVSFAHGLSHNPVVENEIEEETGLEVADTDELIAESEEELEVTAENEVVDPVDDEVLLDPDYDIGEASVLEHFEIDIIMEAQMAFERDEAPAAGLDIANADQVIEEALVDETELIEDADEIAEQAIELEEEVVEVAERESEPEPESVIDSRELLDSLYENPSRLNTLTLAHYFIFDESLESSQVPTLADLVTSAIVEPDTEDTELVEVGEINEVGQIGDLDTEEASAGEEGEEIRLLAPFGEGSLYANGNSIVDPADCPKAREYSARSREILFSLPESE